MVLRRRLSRVCAVVLLAAGVTGLVGAPALAAPTPSATPGDFYTPPSPLPVGNNGDIIRSEDSYFTFPITGIRVPATVKRIMYRSRDTHGAPIAVTGTVLVPSAPWTKPSPRPLVSYAVGTQGQGDQCAPSHLLNQGLEYEAPFIGSMLALGAAVVVTDYEGLGTPSVHTYLNRVAEGHAVLDAARAAQRLPGVDIPRHGPVGIFGYSQGGGASAAAAELQGTYAPELNLVGSYAGAVPADLPALAQSAEGNALIGVLGYVLNGFIATYPETTSQIEGLLNQRGLDFLAATKGECVIETVLRFGLQHTSSFTKDGRSLSALLNDPANANLLAIAKQQNLGTIKPKNPVLLVQGLHDDAVPVAQGRALRDQWCALGATVDYREPDVPNPAPPGFAVGHVVSAVVADPEGLFWLGQRFAGVPAVNTCAAPTTR